MAIVVDPSRSQDAAPEQDQGNRGKSNGATVASSGSVNRRLLDEKRPIEAWKLRPTQPIPMRRVRRPFDKLEGRDRDIERLVRQSIAKRQEQQEAMREIAEGARSGALRELPRRRFSKTKPGPPPETQVFKDQHFHAGVLATLARLIVWLKVFWAFQLGNLWDIILRRDSLQRRATRLVDLFQGAGGSFTKIGQQLSMRMDLLPYEYCRELSKLLDSVKPFPTSYAIEAVERATGKPIAETFALFDPKPIGSATIACVYQAVLKNGDRVAVKVRRPNIGHVFATDLRAMNWLIRLLETLSVIRAGYLDNFAREFGSTILEELDFRMEAYHQSIFLREARKNKVSKKQFFSAPKVLFELSNQEVLVEEFVSGIWMWELLAAVENNDKDALARMHQLNIDPKKVAERLFWIQLWSQLVAPIFHADPHPANMVVQKDNKIVFIDFGAVGAMSKGKQKLSLETYAAQAKKDVGTAVRCMVAFMEPLPPIDLHQLIKELEMTIGSAMHRMWSRHAPWYEKTSAGLYLKLFEVTQKYDIPVNLDTVRAFRANMLYDTLAMRIYPELDTIDAIKDFLRDYDESLRKSAGAGLRKRLRKGLVTGSEIAFLNEAVDLGARGLGLMRRVLDQPQFSISYMVEKSVFAVIEGVKLVSTLATVSLVAGVIVGIARTKQGLPLDYETIPRALLSSKLYFVALGLPSLITVRRIMMRLKDNDV